jgi:hypothetical protein
VAANAITPCSPQSHSAILQYAGVMLANPLQSEVRTEWRIAVDAIKIKDQDVSVLDQSTTTARFAGGLFE